MSENKKAYITQCAETKAAPLCPQCGKKFVIKKRDIDDPPFWACPGPPECAYGRDVLPGTF